jgi:glycosyltransferase involved in cell wall biosynthesis
MVVTILRSRLEQLEVHEPLLRHGLARTALAVASARVAGAVGRRRVSVVSYAIENRDNYRADPAVRWRRRLRRRIDWQLTRYVAGQLDRIVYGTPDAADLYASLLGTELSRAASRLIYALPAPCTCPAVDRPDPDLVLFLGAFQARKGVPELVAAWPEVARRRPAARLTIVGQGPMQDLVCGLAERVAGVDVVVAPARAEVHRLLRRASVLVLLSQPTRTWREQVGLPLVEALAHGCAVVTTDQTGLAGWLAAHDHHVLAPGAGPEDVARAVDDALGRGRSAESVLADLPTADGRLSADLWLTAPGEEHHAAAAPCPPQFLPAGVSTRPRATEDGS